MNQMKPVTAYIVVIASAVLAFCLLAGGFYVAASSKEEPSPPTPRQTTSTTPTSALPPPPPQPVPVAPQSVGRVSIEHKGQVLVDADYDSMPYELPLNPAGPQETMTRWVEGLGDSPHDAKDGTVYLLGHAWGQQQLVLNPISEAITDAAIDAPSEVVPYTEFEAHRKSTDALNGATVTMDDSHGGRYTWEITDSWLSPKEDALYDKGIMDEKRPGRIVIIACSVDGTNDLGYNTIMEGFLKEA